MHNVIRVKLVLEPIYVCKECGCKDTGAHYLAEPRSLTEADRRVRTSAPSYYMPTEWACYGDGIYRCPSCRV
jgi:hypothetical protein